MVISFVNKSCTQPMNGSVCTNGGPVCFFFGGWGWAGDLVFYNWTCCHAIKTQAKNGGKQFWK